MTNDSLPTEQELIEDYGQIMRERWEEHDENRLLIDEDYDPRDLTPRYLREDEPSEILEDKLREKLKQFKDREELGKMLSGLGDYYKTGILKIYDYPENSDGIFLWDFYGAN